MVQSLINQTLSDVREACQDAQHGTVGQLLHHIEGRKAPVSIPRIESRKGLQGVAEGVFGGNLDFSLVTEIGRGQESFNRLLKNSFDVLQK